MRTLVTAVTCLLVLAMATPAAAARLRVINPRGHGGGCLYAGRR